MQWDVGMVMPKATELGAVMAACRQDMLQNDYTSNPMHIAVV